MDFEENFRPHSFKVFLFVFVRSSKIHTSYICTSKYSSTWGFRVFEPAGLDQLLLDARTPALRHVRENRAVLWRAVLRTGREELNHEPRTMNHEP